MNHLSSPFSITSLVFRFAACCGAGNRFQCGDLPANDESYELYRCGSQDYNTALYAWLVVLLLVLVTIRVLRWLSSRRRADTVSGSTTDTDTEADTQPFSSFSYDFYQPSVWKKLTAMLRHHDLYVSYLSHLPLSTDPTAQQEELLHIRDFCHQVRSVAVQLMLLAGAAVILTLPLLVLKFRDAGQVDGSRYMTHTHTYAWLYSLAYLSGDLPAALLMAGWTVMVLLLIWVLYALEAKFLSQQVQLVDPAPQAPHPPPAGPYSPRPSFQASPPSSEDLLARNLPRASSSSSASVLERMSSMDSSQRRRVSSVSTHEGHAPAGWARLEDARAAAGQRGDCLHDQHCLHPTLDEWN